MQENERWFSDGDCRYCRRASYCGKECKPHKKNVVAAMHSVISEALAKAFSNSKEVKETE